MSNSKPRLRYSSKGWFRFWLTMATGARDFRTGVTLPDEYGCYWRDLWVGPFDTPEEAFSVMVAGA